ncbi:MAG: hypothetical protein HQ518_15030 [Rhodopirellula sp.]|nr:hypothetical protein [Rhodopirellula sp.]
MTAVLEPRTSISPEPPPAVTTGVDTGSPVTRSAHAEAWQRFIDEKLIEWGANPEYFDDEDFDTPSREIITLAIQIAGQFRDAGELPPHRVVPDASGGIVFERRTGAISQKIHIWDDGSVDLIVMDGARVVERHHVA